METHPLLTVTQGRKSAELCACKSRIHEEGILNKLALSRKLLALS